MAVSMGNQRLINSPVSSYVLLQTFSAHRNGRKYFKFLFLFVTQFVQKFILPAENSFEFETTHNSYSR